jgi:hypothetical protein
MTTRLAFIFALVAGCATMNGIAIQTRMTPGGGGEYTLYPANDRSVPQTVDDALTAIQGSCGGAYEVTALALAPTSVHDNGTFLDLNGNVEFGPFRTVVAFECRVPQNDSLNRRLQAIAAQAPPAQPPRPPEPCLVTYNCPVGRVCAPTPEACAEIDRALQTSSEKAPR